MFTGLIVAAAVAASSAFGIGLAGAGDNQPPTESWFDGDALYAGEQRLIPGEGEKPGASGEFVDWSALWEAYLAALYADCMADAPAGLGRCDVVIVDRRADAPPLVPDPITMSDLAAFRPLVGELIVEPDGWGVVGTPTNFYATAETHTMSGELFDVPIEVRWTPTSYVFHYGDGTLETSDASGTPWRGTEESWTETSTSHTYASREDVTASLTVVFTAEVDAGGGWFPVPGTLPVAAPSVPVKLFEVGTVLTDGDCMANPMAAGCG